MSSFTNQKIECPQCGTEGNFTVWQSVNVDLNPDLKSKVLDGSLFEWTCPQCGKTFNVPYTFLYHDMTHNFMVQFPVRTPPVIMAEYIYIRENGVDEKFVFAIKDEYANLHQKEMILFECKLDNDDLQFAIYHMPETMWELTDGKYVISKNEYSVYKSQTQINTDYQPQ